MQPALRIFGFGLRPLQGDLTSVSPLIMCAKLLFADNVMLTGLGIACIFMGPTTQPAMGALTNESGFPFSLEALESLTVIPPVASEGAGWQKLCPAGGAGTSWP